MRNSIILFINGKKIVVSPHHIFQTLAEFLRTELQLTGTKIVCAEGDCGACTVLQGDEKGKFKSINSCIVNLAQLDCSHILTVESLESATGELHEIQEGMRSCHGSQCGYCTPGFVMALAGYFENNQKQLTSEKKARNQLTGNLCRCTGYKPILEAALDVDPTKMQTLKSRYHSREISKELSAARKVPLLLESELGRFAAPTEITDAIKQLHLLNGKRAASFKVLAGGTDLGVALNKGKLFSAGSKKYFFSLHLLTELRSITKSKGKITIGAMVNLQQVEDALTVSIPEFANLIKIFASPQIKNTATLVGNIANGSPIGDTLPILLVLDAELHLLSHGKKRKLPLADFYTGYKKFNLKQGEIITAVAFRIPLKGEKLKTYKVSQRKDLDISFVNSAFLLEIKKNVIVKARIAFGGMAETARRLEKLEKALVGSSIADKSMLQEMAAQIPLQLTPRSDHRGSAQARSFLARNLFLKFLSDLSS